MHIMMTLLLDHYAEIANLGKTHLGELNTNMWKT